MDQIGQEHFAVLVSDNTNACICRCDLTVEEVLTLLGLPDCVHHISSFVKDVVKLPYFKEVMRIVCGTITHFHKVHISIHEFQLARKEVQIGHSLESIGKTRFDTAIISACSVQRCIPAIQKVIEYDIADFSEFCDYFEPLILPSGMSSAQAFEFQTILSRLVNVGLLAVRALTCLKANEANANDFFLFWHAIATCVIETITSPTA
ncbi:hypothetical protein ARMSODRAFT_873266 [Armillaria solidipes]|uniref:Uncharacterized protein n=1 Tax=Armillaria solidipes TaxID=1076256 RepID=A0A2H3CM31_9AGAR|nr:hypothetical protein ARMSODRAFT_873266 [Armillaria solidipes]